MREIRFLAQARADFKAVLENSKQDFGIEVARRYMHLLEVALEDILSDPDLVGTQTVARHSGLIRYPVHWSARSAKVDGKVIRNPRHVIYFRFDSEAERIVVVRILHDRRDPELHL